MLRKATPWAVPMVLRAPEGEGSAGPGGEGSDPNAQTGGDKNQPETVPLDKYKKALDEMHSSRDQVKKMQAEVENLKNQMKEANKQKATESGDFKSLYEQAKTELETVKTTHESFKKSVYDNERIRTLETKLREKGLKQGNENIVDFAPLEKMPHELTSRGRILIHGVEEVANELEQKYPYAFERKKPPTINNGGGADGTGDLDVTKMSVDDMIALERKDLKKYKEIYPAWVKNYNQKRLQGG